MLCCFDASVQSDDEYAARKKSSKRSKKKKTFREVQLSVGDAYKHMNGRIPANTEGSIQSGASEEDDKKDDDTGQQLSMAHFEMDVLKHQVQQLQIERDDYQNRLSRYASSSLTDNNPSITDLTDPNRPDQLAQRVAELYDNQWTDAYIYLTDLGMTEKAAVGVLSEIFKTVYRVCKTLATQQMSSMGAQIGFFTGFDHIPDHFMTHVKMYKDERKKNYRKFLPVLEKKARKHIKTVRGLGDYFFLEALETCWLMCIQDPPMALDFACFPGDVFDSKTFRAFTNPGSHVDYLVWPALRLYENGPLLCKGFAQGRKGIPNTSQEVTRRLTQHHGAQPKSDVGNMYRRRDTSAHLSRISESSQEYQTSFLSSEYSKSNSGRSSDRFYSTYDSQSQMTRSSSTEDIRRPKKDNERFLKNADFETANETDSFTNRTENDATVEERFVVPGRHEKYTVISANKTIAANDKNISTEQKENFSSSKITNENIHTDHKRVANEGNQAAISDHDDHQQERPISSQNANGSMQKQLTVPLDAQNHLVQEEEKRPWQDFFDETSENHQHANEDPEHKDNVTPSQRDSAHEVTITPSFTSTSKTPPVTESPGEEQSFNVHARKAFHLSPGSSPTKAKSPGTTPISNSSSLGQFNAKSVKHKQKSRTPSGSLASKKSLKKKVQMSAEDTKSNFEHTKSLNEIDSQRGSPNDCLKNKIPPVKSPVPFLTVKVNKIKRIPKRRHLEEENEERDVGEYKTDPHKHNGLAPDYTPRNVPSVESIALRSVDTSRLSRNTSRHTNVTATPRKGRQSETNDVEHTSRHSVDKHKHSHQGDKTEDSPGRTLVMGSQMSDQGYVSQAVSDYSPRKKHSVHTVAVIKQYPAVIPDFSHTIKMRPDSRGQGVFVLTPKPAPKIPGAVAAKLRFAMN